MVGRLSLTRLDTPDIHNWKEGELLLLGLWCLEQPLETGDLPAWVSIVPYHWDDREKFRRDRAYLIDLSARLEVGLASFLNSFHGATHTDRFWRIITGPWLWTFAAIVFDRWEMVSVIRDAVRSGDLVVSQVPSELKVPSSYGDFVNLFMDDAWNAQVLAKTLDHQLATSTEELGNRLEEAMKKEITDGRREIAAQRSVKFSRPYARGTGLQARGEALLVGSLGRVPRRPRSNLEESSAAADRPNFDSRFFVPGSRYEAFLAGLISSQIPIAYCEDFPRLRSAANKLWRRPPSVICSGPGVYEDEIFKTGIAQATEVGSRLVQLQHGGFYGVGETSFSEIHEVRISDEFLTWGWAQSHTPNVKPVGVTKRKLRGRVDPMGSLLISLGSIPRFSFAANSAPVSSQYCRVFHACAGLLEGLDEDVRRQTRLRLYPLDMGWKELEFYKSRFPDLTFDEPGFDFRRSTRSARLTIATYNSTGFLETFAAGIPTICFMESEALELRPEAEDSFARLEDAGVLFRSAEAASNKINQVWGDVSGWWESPEVKAAVGSFVNLYARDPGNRVLAVRRAIRSSARS